MNPQRLIDLAIRPALEMLIPELHGLLAERLLVAIAVQESGITHRAQIGGPARGWWQFERIGVEGVLRHRKAGPVLSNIAAVLGYPPDAHVLHSAIEHNDLLAAATARLALWTDPHPLPGDSANAWACYLRVWRPGHPRPEHWDASWARAMAIV